MYICSKCLAHATSGTTTTKNGGEEASSPTEITSSSRCCCVCLGFWQSQSDFSRRLESAIEMAMEPYCSCTSSKKNVNCFVMSRKHSPPMMILPGDLVYRFLVQQQQQQQLQLQSNELSSSASATTTTRFGIALKQHSKHMLDECLSRIEEKQQQQQNVVDDYPSCVKEEEQGFLAVHVIVTPRNDLARPTHLFPRDLRKRKRKYQQQQQQYQDEPSQGGDARENLELRLLRQQQDEGGAMWMNWTINQALAHVANNSSSSLEHNRQPPFPLDLLQQHESPSSSSSPLLDIHVAVWRRPFYLRGEYTKCRRDVSQTPFFVDNDDNDNSNGKKRQRRKLGVSSVQEEIVKVVTQHCGGISERNNNNSNDNDNNNVLFGMAKFHASGREDLDVRMLLPADPSSAIDVATTTTTTPTTTTTTPKNAITITGRPFVCEVIDAFCLPTLQDLSRMVHDINHSSGEGGDCLASSQEQNGNITARWFGNNPMGVGISSNFSLVPASCFRNLQAETEQKVKHYGCLCWSEHAFISVDELEQRLVLRLDDNNNNNNKKLLFPLTIQQQTPLRVLHRRSNMVRTRHILSCRLVQRVDDHYFRLHLSTSAGTYVKEFVTGDLGRTSPSVSSLLGCKADIMELDCEGIEMQQQCDDKSE